METKNKSKIIILKYIPYVIIFIMCILVMLFMVDTSPIKASDVKTDSSVFISTANEMLQGKVVYRDTFDHKGPIIYIINIIGLLISPSSLIGIWFVEVISIFIACIFLYKSFELYFKENKCILSLLLVSMFLGIMANTRMLELGNLVEEYALPFIAIGIYLFFKYALSDEIEHKPKYMFFHGILCMFTMLLRPNMIAVWVSVGVIVTVKLLVNKKIKNLFINILAGLLGLLVVFLPVAIYFGINNGFKDFIYSVFEFNMKYSADELKTKIEIIKTIIKGVLNKFLIVAVISIISGIVGKKFKNGITIFSVLFLSTSIIVISFAGRVYGHYYMNLLPAIIVSFIFIIEMLNKKMIKKFPIVVSICVMCLNVMAIVGYKVIDLKKFDDIYNSITEELENGDLYVLGNKCTYYLNLDSYPDFKYKYIIPITKIDNNIIEETAEYIATFKPKYIIVDKGHIGDKKLPVYDLVKENYDLVCIQTDELYKIKE